MMHERPPSLRASPFVWREPATIPRRQWLYGTHLIRGFVSLTIAPGAVGKTSLLIADALSLATGRPLVGTHVHGRTPRSIWLWNLEDPREEIERRVVATMMHHGVAPEDVGGRLYMDSGRDMPLCLAEAGRDGVRILAPVVDALVEELVAREIDVLVVDPFVSSHRVPENDNGAIDAVAKAWADVAHRAGCAVELVHHLRKLNGAEATAESARGGVALVAAARSTRVLNRMTADEAEKAGVDNHRLYFRAMDDKGNLAPPADASEWFRLESVELGNSREEGGALVPGDRVGVVVPWKWPSLFDDLIVDDLLAVQRAIHGKHCRKDPQAKAWVGNVVADVLGLDVADKAAKGRVKALLRTWTENGALIETTALDDNRRPRPVIEVGTWANETAPP